MQADELHMQTYQLICMYYFLLIKKSNQNSLGIEFFIGSL